MRKVLHNDFGYLEPSQQATMEEFCREFVDTKPNSAPASFLGVVDVFEKPKLLLAIHERAECARDEAGRYSVATTDGDETCAWETMSVHELPDRNYRVSIRCRDLVMGLTVIFDESTIANADWRDGPEWATTTTPKTPSDFQFLEQQPQAA